MTKDYQSFSSTVCMPSQFNCADSFNLDEVASVFEANNWSMMPMLSHDTQLTNITDEDIDNYVAFASWFISKYKDQASIQYVELLNDPNKYWKGSTEQLITLMNRTYDAIKAEHPSVKIGTVGLEYWLDEQNEGWQRNNTLLDPANGLKFDFWAFHAYPLAEMPELANFVSLPPTRTPATNKWAGNTGILELRQKFIDNGWQDREIVDTEHVFATPGPVSEDADRLAAAYMVQDFAIKSGLTVAGKAALQGTSGLKIVALSNTGEMAWGSLDTDGSITQRVQSVGILWQKVQGMTHQERISGAFDDENSPWVEKFTKNNGHELYVYFKPFVYHPGESIKFDGGSAPYDLQLPHSPQQVTNTDLYGQTETLGNTQSVSLVGTNEPQYLEVTYGP